METGMLIREGVPAILNPFDAHALEAAILLKGQFGGKVTVLTMGPPAAEAALIECVEQGADRGILISDRKFSGADTLATSYVLAHAIKSIQQQEPVDIVLFGKQAIDGDTAQVGPGVATRLQIPVVSCTVKIESFDPLARVAVIHRKTERGIEVLHVPLPALLTVEKDIAPITLAPLPNLLRAARYKPELWSATEPVPFDLGAIGIKGSPTIVGKAYTPPAAKGGDKIIAAQLGIPEVVTLALKKMTEAGFLEPAQA